MQLLPFKPFRKTTNSLYILGREPRRYFVKCYNGPGATSRHTQEKFILDRWDQFGFNVPKVHDQKIAGLGEPYLVVDFIDGISLREYLSDSSTAYDKKLEVLARLFCDMQKRHTIALRNKDACLIQLDANSGNILCTENGFYFIDFENPSRKLEITRLAAIELATICRWIVRDMGIEHTRDILGLAISAYAHHTQLLMRIIENTCSRPLQFYHRWKNHKLKLARPCEVTKYDIADSLAELLKENAYKTSAQGAL